MRTVPHGTGPATFLRLPASMKERIPGGGIELLRFGGAPADLDYDFDADDRAGLVTNLLQRCSRSREGVGLDEEVFWNLPVGTRLHALVVLCLLAGRREITWSVDCPASGCGERIDLGLPLADVARAAEMDEGLDSVELQWEGEYFELRLPRGNDLRRWAAGRPSDTEMLAVLADLPGEPDEISPELATAVETTLAAADPLVDLRVRSICPACGRGLDLPVDLEAEALALLRQVQEELFREVRILAGAFHWSEREILELPTRRRRRYLAMLAREEA